MCQAKWSFFRPKKIVWAFLEMKFSVSFSFSFEWMLSIWRKTNQYNLWVHSSLNISIIIIVIMIMVHRIGRDSFKQQHKWWSILICAAVVCTRVISNSFFFGLAFLEFSSFISIAIVIRQQKTRWKLSSSIRWTKILVVWKWKTINFTAKSVSIYN